MNDSKKARTIKPSTEKKLFALSKNQCYHPHCTNQLITNDKKDVLAKIAHIEAASSNGPRFNPNMTDDERRDFDNLILLCDKHHIEVDSHAEEFPTELLQEWKLLHEGTDSDALFKYTLKTKYLNDFKTISLLSNIPKSIDSIFVNLAIIKEQKEGKNNEKLLNREAFLSSYEEIHKPKEPIAIEELINKSNKSLIYGKAGIGKTTLCKYIVYKWAKEEFYSEFEYVIYIPLREWESDGIKGAIRDYYYSHDVKELSISFDSNKTLFLFDGYDELDADRKKLLRDEIEKYTLTHYLITTRPYGYQKSDFRVDEYFETIGFTDENVTEYINNFFAKDSEKAKDLKSYLKNNISIKHIGYIPLMLEMICSMWEQNSFDFDMTMTELYTQSIENIFFEYTEKNGTAYIQDQEEEIFNYLGKIAFEGLTQQTIVLDKKIIKEKRTFFSDYVLKAGFLNDGKAEKSNPLLNSYQFPHLTFQEYFSALYISKLEPKEQSEIIRDWKFYPHMQMFFAFLGGLIEDKEFLLEEIESEPQDLSAIYNFFLITRIIRNIKHDKFNVKRITNIMIHILIQWSLYCEEDEKFEIIEEFYHLSKFIDNDFISTLMNKIKESEKQKYIYEILDLFNKDDVSMEISNNYETNNFIYQSEDFFYEGMDFRIEVLRDEKEINRLINFVNNNSIDFDSQIRTYIKLSPLNILDDKVVNLLLDFIQNGNRSSTKGRAIILKGLAFSGRNDDEFMDVIINFVQNENLDSYYRRMAVRALFLLERNDNKFINKIISIIENENIHPEVRIEVSMEYSFLDKSNKGVDKLLAILQDETIDEFYQDRGARFLATLTFKKRDVLKIDVKKFFPEIFIKKSSIKSFFYAFDNDYIELNLLIQNAFHNIVPLYLKNKKLHTIENGKEISTQREVDEATLNEIKMLLREEGLDDKL